MLQGLSMRTYRVIHRLHHKQPVRRARPGHGAARGYPRGRMYLVRKLLKDLSGLTAWKTYAYFLAARRRATPRPTCAPAARRHIGEAAAEARSDRNMVIGFHLALLAVFAASGYLLQYLVLWVLPLVTVVQAILRLRAIAEHGATTDFSSPLTAARTNLGPAWLRWLIFRTT